MKSIFAVIAALFSIASFGSVVGKRIENLGTMQPISKWADWLRTPGALITPEAGNLAVQSCLRDSQEQLDALAYDLGVQLVQAIKTQSEGSTGIYESGLNSLAKMIEGIQTLKLPRYATADHYQKACHAKVSNYFKANEKVLGPLFEGRMRPTLTPELRAKNFPMVALNWGSLADQICVLEGYYSTSYNPKLWVFFSTTRALSNVLAAEKYDSDLIKALSGSQQKQIMALIHKIDTYSSVAGKFNGASFGMSDEERTKAPMRMTGVAMGSRATSLMAFFTTAWREKLQDLIVTQSYPKAPFQLLSLVQVIDSVDKTGVDVVASTGKRLISQTEKGMQLVLASLSDTKAYGPGTQNYRRNAALAWLALNAETNIRQNEKLAGPGGSAPPPPKDPTTLVFGAPTLYALLTAEIDSALESYKVVDPGGTKTPFCVKNMREFSVAAQAVKENQVGNVPLAETQKLLWVKFEPVIADIGHEVSDPKDGNFRLHLATGHGRTYSQTVNGKVYSMWTPSAHTLHLNSIMNTSQWRRVVNKYDIAAPGGSGSHALDGSGGKGGGSGSHADK